MNEVMQIRAASWAAMIKQRNDSGLTIREWCAANGIQESVYYYRLNRLRKMALDVEETPAPASQNISVSERFAQLPFLLLQTQRQQSVSAVETRLWK